MAWPNWPKAFQTSLFKVSNSEENMYTPKALQTPWLKEKVMMKKAETTVSGFQPTAEDYATGKYILQVHGLELGSWRYYSTVKDLLDWRCAARLAKDCRENYRIINFQTKKFVDPISGEES